MQVFHSNKFIGYFFGKEEVTFPKDYTKVADVNCDTVDSAYALTNSTDKPWHENPEVKIVPTEKGGYRSTSIGDVIEDNGKYYLCANIGWKEISPENN